MTTSEFSVADPAPEQGRRDRLAKFLRRCFLGDPRRNAKGFVSVGIIVTAVTAMAVTLFGVAAVSPALDLYDGAIWIWNSGPGEAARINTSAGRVDTRVPLSDAQGHRLKAFQNDRYLLLQDLDTGTVTSLNLATLGVSGVITAQPPADMRIGLFAGNALTVDAAHGLVSQRDAGSFKPSGSPLKIPKNLIGGDFDDKGRFWVGSPDTGEVIAIKPGKKGKGPRVDHKVNVSHKGHPWAVSVLDDGVAIMDPESSELIAVNGEGIMSKTAIPPMDAAVTMPARVRGDVIPITNPENRNVVVVQGSDISDGSVAQGVTARALPISGSGKKLGTAVAFSDRLYIPDEDANLVRVVDLAGKSLDDINTAGGRIEMEIRENHLVMNSESTGSAWVINQEHKIAELQKAPTDVAVGRLPDVEHKASTTPPPSSSSPSSSPPANSQSPTDPTASSRPKLLPSPTKPPAPVPDSPVIVRILGNKDGSVTVEWDAPDAHGAALQSYDIHATTSAPGGNRTFSGISHVSGSTLQRMMIEPRALVAGATYTFTVVARSTNGVSNPSAPSQITRFEP